MLSNKCCFIFGKKIIKIFLELAFTLNMNDNRNTDPSICALGYLVNGSHVMFYSSLHTILSLV